MWMARFQSTPLMRGATAGALECRGLRVISIHAPHARGDMGAGMDFCASVSFQSTPLMRGATVVRLLLRRGEVFQSTPLMRGATRGSGRPPSLGWYFNPRPSCEGRRICPRIAPERVNFNPRPSCEGRPSCGCATGFAQISIHAPHARGDWPTPARGPARTRFQSTPLMRGATGARSIVCSSIPFQSTPLMRGATCAPAPS